MTLPHAAYSLPPSHFPPSPETSLGIPPACPHPRGISLELRGELYDLPPLALLVSLLNIGLQPGFLYDIVMYQRRTFHTDTSETK